MALCREFGPENVGPVDRRRHGQPRRADPLLHRRDPRQHRAARGRRTPTSRRGDGRVPLLRRPRARRRLAGAAAHAAAGAVPADVGDARRHAVLRGGAHARSTAARRSPSKSGDRARCRSSTPTPRCRWRTRSRSCVDEGKTPGLRRPLHAGRRGRERAGLHQPEDLHAASRRPRSPSARRLRVQQPVRRRHAQVAAARHRAAPRRAAAEVPRARRATRAARPAQGDLRHRHARRRHQRARSARCCSRGCASSTARRRRT